MIYPLPDYLTRSYIKGWSIAINSANRFVALFAVLKAANQSAFSGVHFTPLNFSVLDLRSRGGISGTTSQLVAIKHIKRGHLNDFTLLI